MHLGFWQKGLFYHLCLTASKKRKVYILKIVPEDSISLIYLVSLLFGMEKRTDPLNEEERDVLKCTEAALRNYIVEREKCYWKTKEDFGFPHFIYACTENLLPSHPLPFPVGNNHAGKWGPSPVVHILVHKGKWHPTPSRMWKVRKNLDC